MMVRRNLILRYLTKLNLINWHYFNDETIHFHKHGNLITGGTGAGKSTILDALQVLLVADFRQLKFNRSANDQNSKRNVVSYLRGGVSSEGVDFKRGDKDFTSYITAEIELEQWNKVLLLGVVFDFNASSKNMYHSFFKIEDHDLNRELFYKEGNVLYTQEEFQVELKKKRIKHRMYKGDVSGYLNDVKQILGGVKDSFFRLFQKGIAFENITNLKHFIYEFVLDADPLNSENLRESFEKVREMESAINKTEEQITALKEIEQRWKEIENLDNGIKASQYISKKSRILAEEDNKEALIEERSAKSKEFGNLEGEIEKLDSEQGELDGQIRRLIVNIDNHDVSKKIDILNSDIKTLDEEIKRLNGLKKNLNNKMTIEVKEREYLSTVLTKFSYEGNLSGTLNSGKNDWLTLIDKSAQGDLFDISIFNVGGLNQSWRAPFKWVQDQIVVLNQNKGALDIRKNDTKVKIAELEKNRIIPNSHPSVILKKLLVSELRSENEKDVPVYIVCEVIDVPNEKWKNAVEGYLKNLKFNIIVPPEYFNDALQIYHDHKFSHGISGVGLVNIEKMKEELRAPLKGSLSEEITTTIPEAQVFTDYVLGSLIKCDDVKELKKYKRSITPDCMVYQNHTARQIPKRDYEVPFIGREAVKVQLKKTEEELKGIEQELLVITDQIALCKNLEDLRSDKQDFYDSLFNQLIEVMDIAQMEEQLLKMQQELLDIDTSEIDEMNATMKMLEGRHETVREFLKGLIGEKGGLEKEIRLMSQTIDEISESQIKNMKEFDMWLQALSVEALELAEERWEKRRTDWTYEELVTIYRNNADSSESRKNNTLKPRLVSLRSGFNKDYHFGADAISDDNDDYHERLVFLEDTRLVEFKDIAKERREKAYQSFQEDFISKLQERIIRSKQTFDALNFSLGKLDFGGDKYKFHVMRNRDYERYYDMIMDNDLISDGLFSDAFQEKHQETMNEFFKEISFEENRHSDFMEQLMDYRTYLDFEIDIKDRRGNEFKYSKKFASNSGGESQVPFYIAVLASFFHAYQMHRKVPDTFRLVVFDEAFNRMDNDRVEECIRFINDCGFQPIIVTPTTSLQTMAPLLPNATMVLKNEENFVSEVIQLTKEEWELYQAQTEEEMNHVLE
jgi:uncharacterized protein YPO0396